MDGSEKIGKIYIAVEITQVMSNEITEIDNRDFSVPLLKHVHPKLRIYQLVFLTAIVYKIKFTSQHTYYYRLVVLFWGLRQLNVHLQEPFVRLFCSSLYIDSDIIKNINSFPNFPNIINKKCVFSLVSIK